MDRRGRALTTALSVLSFQSALVAAVPSRLDNRLVSRAQPETIGDFTYKGCFAEPEGARALAAVLEDPEMTLEMCGTLCADRRFFGVEYGVECWCGDVLHDEAAEAAEADCSFDCPGGATEEKCGAGWRLSLFENLDWTALPPQVPTSFDDFEYQGCFVDPVVPRLLPSPFESDEMTPQICAQHCTGMKYIGVEYGRECWCGNAMAGTPQQVPDSDCSFNCAGDATQKCGAGGRINVYMADDFTPPPPPTVPEETTRVGDYLSKGCWTDEGPRTLTYFVGNAAMTLEMCAAQAAAGSYKYFGVEWSQECWMGNELLEASSSADVATCNMPCGGDATQLCGGDFRMNLFEYKPIIQVGDEIELDLDTAVLENAEVIVVDGETVISFAPPPGGSATLEFPEVDIEPEAGVGLQVEIEINTGDDVINEEDGSESLINKRAFFASLCNIAMAVNNQVVYSAPIVATGGLWGRISSAVLQAAAIRSLAITQSCPGVSFPILVKPPVFVAVPPEVVPDPSFTTTSTSTTATPTPTPSSTSTTSSTSTSSTTSSSTSSSAVATTPPTPTEPEVVSETICARSYPRWTSLGRCSVRYGPIVTWAQYFIRGPIAIPAAATEDEMVVDTAYQQCAAICSWQRGCKTFAVDRGNWPADRNDWGCYLYNEITSAFQRPGVQTANVMWFSNMCYLCTLDPLPIATTVVAVPTYSAPAYNDQRCRYGGRYDTYECNVYGTRPPPSGYGIMAVATGVPTTNDYQAAQICGGLCKDLGPACKGYSLDHGAGWRIGPLLNGPMNCTFYSFDPRITINYYYAQAGNTGETWYVNDCFGCTAGTLPEATYPVLPSTSSTVATTSSSTSTSSIVYPTVEPPPEYEPGTTTSSAPETTPTYTPDIPVPPVTTTSQPGPSYSSVSPTVSPPTTTSSPPVPAPTCSKVLDPPEELGCDIKGFASPARPYDWQVTAATLGDCAAYCAQLNAVTPGRCTSFMFLGASNKWCIGYEGIAAWDVLAEGAAAGPSYRLNILQDAACWTCPDGVTYTP